MKKLVVAIILVALILCVVVPAMAAVTVERTQRTTTRTWNRGIENQYRTEIRQVTLHRHTVYNWNGAVVSVTVDPAPSNFTYLFDSWTESNTFVEVYDPYFTMVTESMLTVMLYHNVVYQISYYDTSETLPPPPPPYPDPVVLDLNGDSIIPVAKNFWKPHEPEFHMDYVKFFDLTGDGAVEATEWMAPNPGDGMLCMPEDGKVETALQLFGTAGGYDDGLHKLSIVCDKDKNGWVEGEELEGLAIWIDENNDAVCQSREIKKLSDYNIKRIYTKHSDYVGKYETNDGRTMRLWNWWPSTREARKFRKS